MGHEITLAQVLNYVNMGGLVVIVSVIYRAVVFIKNQSKKELEIQNKVDQNSECIRKIKGEMVATKNKLETDQREVMKKVESYAEKMESKIDEVKLLLMNYFMKNQE